MSDNATIRRIIGLWWAIEQPSIAAVSERLVREYSLKIHDDIILKHCPDAIRHAERRRVVRHAEKAQKVTRAKVSGLRLNSTPRPLGPRKNYPAELIGEIAAAWRKEPQANRRKIVEDMAALGWTISMNGAARHRPKDLPPLLGRWGEVVKGIERPAWRSTDRGPHDPTVEEIREMAAAIKADGLRKMLEGGRPRAKERQGREW